MLFKKKPKYEAPITTNFFVSFNLTEIDKWLKNKDEVPPQKKSEWNSISHVEEYKITMLPHDPFLFYHEGLRAFSTTISGGEYFDEYEIDIEWEWQGHERGFVFTANRFIIFLAPIDEVRYLLVTGKFLGNTLDDEEVIPTIASEVEESYSRSVFRKRSSAFKFLSYSNALASLSVEPQTTLGNMDYSNKKKR